MSFGSPLAEGRLLARHLAVLQQEKMALAAQNAELMRTTRALSERCALLEAACSTRDALDGTEDADAQQLECCAAEERADRSGARAAEQLARELQEQLADAVTRASDAESRAAASDECAAALATRVTAAEAQVADTESRHHEVVSALMDARTSLAQLRFEHDEASLAHRRRVAELSSKLERLQCLQAADCARVAALEVQLADCERSKAALARECAARRQECEALKAPRKPLAEVTNSAPTGGIRAFAERWQQEW